MFIENIRGCGMFRIFGRKSDEKKVRECILLEMSEPVDCIADFTFNFYWQHKGDKLDPEWKIPGNQYTYGEVVEHLKRGGNIKIKGDVGHRLGSSMGVDLKYFQGTGSDIPVGDVYVEGNVDTRMGISMTRGCIYVKGEVKEPVGNLVQVKSDVAGYKKFRSITDILTEGRGKDVLIGCSLQGNKLIIADGMVKDTVGARLDVNREIIVEGDVDLSTGILMRQGVVRVNGQAGKNTGALLNGGTVIINGDTDDFTGIDMISGIIIVNGNAGKFLAANKKNGKILARNGSPIPPCKENQLKPEDQQLLIAHGFKPLNFKKYS